MMLRSAIGLGLLVFGLSAVPGVAGEMLATGKVLRVVPINAKSRVMEQSGECEPAKPSHDPKLAALLAWDLRTGCRTTSREVEVVEGYRVYYEWDDRVYDTVMTERPAETIPLRVNLQ